LANVRIRGKISHTEWPKITERFRNGETLTEIARSYHCTAPAIRYIVNRVSARPMGRKMERDKIEKIAVLAPSSERRRHGAFSPGPATNDIWSRVNNDIATFLAAMDSLSSDDSDRNCEALLLATDRLLWAAARTRLELERMLNGRKQGAAIRRLRQ
jgi:hypothetical protein